MKKQLKVILFFTMSTLIFSTGCSHSFLNSNDQSVPATSEGNKWNGFPDEVLIKGDEGSFVSQLQNGLNQIGYEIEVTELFDEDTVWALTDFQLQNDHIHVTGLYDTDTKNALEEALYQTNRIEPGSALPKSTDEKEDEKVMSNPYDVLALINKDYSLPADYIPHDLVIPNVRFPFTEDLPKKQLREVAAGALEQLFEAADEAGLDLYAQSGYRSYERQVAIFASNVELHGEDHANTFSARPGESEHQSGLTMDVTSPEVGFDLNTDFADTKEGIWIQQHAHEFGFIIRYPEGKEHITQYQYEPWHLRYVGPKAAAEITSQNLTLEEYLGAWHPNN